MLTVVTGALLATGALAVTVGAAAAGGFLSGFCVAAAVVRGVLRGRRPPGLAVRSTLTDVTVLLALAVAIGVLSFSPGV